MKRGRSFLISRGGLPTFRARMFLALAVALAAIVAGQGPASEASPPSLRPAVEVRGFTASLDPAGGLWAVWSAGGGYDADLWYSRRIGEGWEVPRTLYAAADTWDESPSLAFAADGTPWVAWSSGDREGGVLYVTRWLGSRWSRPERVPTEPSARPRQPVLAAAPGGGLWLAWVGFDGVDDEVFGIYWDGGRWSAAQQVGQDDADRMAYDTQPRLAVDAGGAATLVWVSSEGLFDDAVVASRWDGESWSPEERVSRPDETPDVWPSLALDRDGRPWVAWQDVAGTGAETRWRIFVARREAGANTWSSEALVSSPPDAPLDETRPSLGIDTGGNPHLVWAVTGAAAGLGYSTWTEGAWTLGAWVAEAVAPDAPLLLLGDRPQVLWRPAVVSEWAAPDGGQSPPLVHRLLAGPLPSLPQTLPQSEVRPEAQCIYNRYVAWGDSITWGGYDDPLFSGNPVGPYPERLEAKLDARVTASEVINSGIAGERVNALKGRIGGEAATYLPQFPLILEGTNDVTHDHSPSEVVQDLAIIIDILKKYANIDGIRPWLSTLPPRLDTRNDETETMNMYIASTADGKGVPYADTWQAFYDYGDWESLFVDDLHPNRMGMQVLTDNWYNSILDQYVWLYEDTTPPTTWIEPLPSQSECGLLAVQWGGEDNVSWVTDYDLQVQVDGGPWSDWLVATEATSGLYDGGSVGDTVGIRVRGRDAAGNQSSYGSPEVTQIAPAPPIVVTLPAYQTVPFEVGWSADEACGTVSGFDVQYQVGPAGAWVTWLSSTPDTSAVFDPPAPQYGAQYGFSARAEFGSYDWSDWSDPVSTTLARLSLSGWILTVRGEPVLLAQVNLDHGLLGLEVSMGRYTAYLDSEGDYDLDASRAGFGELPPMHVQSATSNLDDLDFVLPPEDDGVSDGGFEAGEWGDWVPGGALPPTLSTDSHTGDGAVRLGGSGGLSTLSQALLVPGNLSDATLSLLVRLEDPGAGSSTLALELSGTPISHAEIISTAGWLHLWLPVEAAAGQATTLILTVDDGQALLLDEVTLGSARHGGRPAFLPLIGRGYGP